MLNKLRQPFGPTTRFLLGLAGILALLLLTAAAWCLLPALPRFTISAPAPLLQLMFSADGRTLATAHPQSLILWDLPSGEERKTLPIEWTHFPDINTFESPFRPQQIDNQLRLSPDGQTVVYSERHVQVEAEPPVTSLKLWNAASDLEPVLLPGACKVEAFVGRNVVTQGYTSIAVWDAVTGQERKSWKRAGGFLRLPASAWAVGDDLLVLQPADFTLTVCDVHTLNERFSFPGIGFKQVAVFGSADVKLLAAAQEGSVTVWDLTTGKERGSFLLPLQYASDPARCPTTGERMLNDTSPVSQCQLLHFRSDGTHLLAVVAEGPAPVPRALRLHSWDVSTVPFPDSGPGWEFVAHPLGCLSPDGQWFLHMDAASGWLPSSTATGQPQTTLAALDMIEFPSFAPNSQTLAGFRISEPGMISRWLNGTPQEDRVDVRLWSVSTGHELAAFKSCSCYAFCPDGNSLAIWEAGSLSGAEPTDDHLIMQFWDIRPRRSGWIEYGLPVLFVLLLLLAVWHCLRFRRKFAGPAMPAGTTTSPAEIAPC